MRVGGIEVGHAKPKDIVFPREGENGEETFVRIVAQQVVSLDEFDAACPKPRPGGQYTREGWQETDTDAPAYKQAMSDWRARRTAFIYIKSLEPSEIEWNLVKLDDPATWVHWEEDLRSFLGHFELNQVVALVNGANALDEAALEKARASFFLTKGQAEATQASIGPNGGPVST